MNKKKLIIVSLLGILLLILVIFLINWTKDSKNSPNEPEKVFVPEYLNSEEKQSLGIPEEAKIQVINRDNNGKVSIYKVVESDNQVVNPEEVSPLSPRTEQSE